jgi:LuxR family maltose regulon positive regulatory protein
MEPLLATKIAVPTVNPSLISRPHLFSALDKPLKVWVISALAGAGKTMLVAKWLRLRGHRTAWFSIDHNDNDSQRFAQYLNAAMESASALVKAADQPLYIVLDSYENITSQSIHDLLTEYIRTSGTNERFIILSRLSVPSQLVENSRSYGYLGGLTCMPEEVTQIVRQSFAEVLPEGVLTALSEQLQEQTEGWITGVKLAVDGLQRCAESELGVYLADPIALVTRHIEEYLIQETLFIQPRKLQRFMLYTSILTDFNAELCRLLTDQEDSTELLEEARRANLLITTEAEDGQHIQHYPRLLSAALQTRLKRLEPEILPVLHQQVAAWYEAQYDIVAAIEHWLLTTTPQRAVSLIEEHIATLLDRQEYGVLRRWLASLMPSLIKERPLLALLQTGLQALDGDMRQLNAMQTTLDQVRQQMATGDLQMMLYMLASQLAPHAPTWTDRAEPDGLAVNQAHRLWLQGDLLGAEAQLMEQLPVWRAQSAPQLAPALVQLGRVQIARNKLPQAESTLLEAVRTSGESASSVLALACLSLAEVYFEWNRIEDASSYLQRCFTIRDQAPELRVASWLLYSNLSSAVDHPQHATSALRMIHHLLPSVSAGLQTLVTTRQLMLDIAAGDLSSVWRWFYRCGLNAHDTFTYAQWQDYRLLAWVSLQLRKPDDAIKLSETLISVSQHSAWDYRTVQSLILLAVAQELAGHVNAALQVIAQAVTLAEAGGMIRSFLDGFKGGDHPVLRLLKMLKNQRTRQAEQHGTFSEAYLQQLIAAGEPNVPRSAPASNAALIEPLSTREQEIMRLLAQGYSNQKIAARLLIAESTVKRHINNIYGKLQVNSRTQALRKAEELGLI